MKLKVDDIRPLALDEGKQRAMEEDLERLYVKKDSFIEVDCPACSSSTSIFEFENFNSEISFFKEELCEKNYNYTEVNNEDEADCIRAIISAEDIKKFIKKFN